VTKYFNVLNIFLKEKIEKIEKIRTAKGNKTLSV